MIGDMLNNNKRREVKTRADQQMYLGKKYRQDKKSRLLRLYEWGAKKTSRGYVGSGSGDDCSPGVRNTPRRLG